ncbi:MAG TPA: DUF937 domain-containing protein [Vicinamibacterales bacterium]|jgi:hypothetical protein|nr:DUF937 domain-containing protein [Vicinamibacterales bacterium]
MSLLDSILGAQGGAAVQQLGAQLGLGQNETTSALSALVPALAAGIQQNAQSEGGLSSLVSALTNGSHQQYVNNPTTLADPSTVDDGNAILGHVFGSKDVSRQVAAQASSTTGIGQDVLKKMLPMAAALVMGALANHASTAATNAGVSGSALGNALGGSLGGSLASVIGPSLMGMLGATLNQGQAGASGTTGGGLAGMLGKLFGG